MDLTALDLHVVEAEGADMALLHPGTGEETGVTFRVIGYDAEAVEAATREFRKGMMNAKKRPAQEDVLSGLRRTRAKAALVGVEGGSGSTTTVDEFHALMDQPGFVWIVEQVEGFAGNRASFFKSAETP